jgi:hypothetical protein
MRVRFSIFGPRDLRLLQSIVRLSPAAPLILPSLFPRPLPLSQSQRCRPISTTLCRPAKRKIVKTLKELQQGVVLDEALDDVQVVEDEPQYPPVVLQARNNMLKFSNCVLLTRVGNFYEVRNDISIRGFMENILTWTALSRSCSRVCATTEPQTC